MNEHTKEFLSKLSDLLGEYRASIEIEGDSYHGGLQITLEVLNPKTFDETYDQWRIENPEQDYPHEGIPYCYAEWVDLGYHVNSEKIKELLK